MQIRCPHCRIPVELIDDSPMLEAECPSCGSSFGLAEEEATTWKKPEFRPIAHFQLIRQLGVGAFGAVWQANDTDLDRQVAVKIPRKGRLSSSEAEQFLREARSAAQLKHPNIVAVHEVGREDEQLYIVSDLIKGVTLADRLEAGAVSVLEAAELVATIADAIHHAHEHGVIHRDLKPSNVMLDADNQPHVMDFGLAKRDAAEITMTLEGAVLGTPAYMSPEQAQGDGHDADARSDIYSLGVILFECLTGERPFRGNTRMLLHQVIHEDPPSPRKLANTIPRDLETICLKCLRKEPERRFESAEALASDLQRWIAGEPIRSRPVRRIEKAWLWCRRRPAVSGLTLMVGLTVLLASGFIWSAKERNRLDMLATRQQNLNERIDTAVGTLTAARGEAVPVAIELLKQDGFPRDLVLAKLEDAVHNSKPNPRLGLAFALADFGEGNVELLLQSIENAPANECENFIEAFQQDKANALKHLRLLSTQANANARWKLKSRLAILALQLGDPSLAGDVHRIEDRPDPTQQTVFIHDVFPTWHGDLTKLAERMAKVDDDPTRAGMCLSIGNLEKLDGSQDAWTGLLTRWHRESPHSAVHSASGWTLRNWKAPLPKLDSESSAPADRDWKATPHGFTLLRIPAGSFERFDDETKQQVTLNHTFWLSDREISVGLFQQFMSDDDYHREHPGMKPKRWPGVRKSTSPSKKHPAHNVSWEDAVLFCNWLSLKDKRQPCYRVKPIAEAVQAITGLVGGKQSTLTVEFLPDADGYRLPTEAEWEHACRGGTTTEFSFGNGEERLAHYAVYKGVKAEVTASKMCNRNGLFDIHGNVYEWCQDWQLRYEGAAQTNPIGESKGPERVCRGGSWLHSGGVCQSEFRYWMDRWERIAYLGIRVAQGPLPVETAAGDAKNASR